MTVVCARIIFVVGPCVRDRVPQIKPNFEPHPVLRGMTRVNIYLFSTEGFLVPRYDLTSLSYGYIFGQSTTQLRLRHMTAVQLVKL